MLKSIKSPGAQAGTMIALPVSGVLADEINWESVFYVFGVLGILWFIFWAYLCHNSPASHPRIDQVIIFLFVFYDFKGVSFKPSGKKIVVTKFLFLDLEMSNFGYLVIF